MSGAGAGSPDEARQALLDGLWQRFRPLVEERLVAIEAYAWSGGEHADACWAAHNLAGSLGSYGRVAAGDVARELDVLLRGEHDVAAVGDLATRRRAELGVGSG